jgi:hypothetical protein
MAVEKKRWLSKESFLDGVALCQLMPGATAMQAAAYVGLKTVRGDDNLLDAVCLHLFPKCQTVYAIPVTDQEGQDPVLPASGHRSKGRCNGLRYLCVYSYMKAKA